MPEAASICSRCGRVRQPGETYYMTRVVIIGDFDGTLPEYSDVKTELSDTMAQASGKTEQELLDEVYGEYCLYLCKNCRDRLVRESLAGSYKEKLNG